MNTKSELRVVFFRTDRGNDPVRDWLEGLGEKMNKYRGGNFEDYLKEKGISEVVSARAKKRWKVLRAEVSVVSEDTKSPSDPPQQHNVFFIASASHQKIKYRELL